MKRWPLKFFKTGEWDVIRERLTDLRKQGIPYNPARDDLFRAMDVTPMDSVKVCILGQDPYPKSIHATGIAFDVPPGIKDLPPTLVNIFREYCDDLHYPMPTQHSLLPWARKGVFLWNVTPTCLTGKPGSHGDWPEWEDLNREIIESLSQRHIVFAFLGSKARASSGYVQEGNEIIEVSHPSPLGANKGFLGSRLFSSINSKLVGLGKEPVDWRLP